MEKEELFAISVCRECTGQGGCRGLEIVGAPHPASPRQVFRGEEMGLRCVSGRMVRAIGSCACGDPIEGKVSFCPASPRPCYSRRVVV